MQGTLLPHGSPGKLIYAYSWSRNPDDLVRIMHEAEVSGTVIRLRYSHHEYYSRVQSGWQLQQCLVTPPGSLGITQVVAAAFVEALITELDSVEYVAGAGGGIRPPIAGVGGIVEESAFSPQVKGAGVLALFRGVVDRFMERYPDVNPPTLAAALHITMSRLGVQQADFAGLLRISPGTLRSALSQGRSMRLEIVGLIRDLVVSRGFRKLGDYWAEVVYRQTKRVREQGGH